jgi:hypothetical protein
VLPDRLHLEQSEKRTDMLEQGVYIGVHAEFSHCDDTTRMLQGARKASELLVFACSCLSISPFMTSLGPKEQP